MKPLHKHSREDWKHLRPLTQGYKTLGYQYMYARYLARRAAHFDEFLAKWSGLADQTLAVAIAFNQPQVIEWLIRFSAKNLTDTRLLIADNSNDEIAAQKIEKLCLELNTPYIRLPDNPSRQAMRSHGLAVGWVYHHVVKRLKPPIFAFIDHDIVPMSKFSFAEKLGDQPFYGLFLDRTSFGQEQDDMNSWFLWAGYCVYSYEKVSKRKLDFRPDWFIGLDTGGNNWWRLYRDFDKSKLRFAEKSLVEIEDPASGIADTMENIDGWLHLGNASLYDNSGPDRRAFFSRVMAEAWKKS